MPDVSPCLGEMVRWPDEEREKHRALAMKQCAVYEKLEQALSPLTPRQFRKVIDRLVAFNDARDELIYMNGFMAGRDASAVSPDRSKSA